MKRKITLKKKPRKSEPVPTEQTEEKEQKEGKLTLKQELFCKYYTSGNMELFGNGTQSYLLAYGLNPKSSLQLQTAKVGGSRLLTFVNVTNRINELLEEGGFNDKNVDKQTLFLINQHQNLQMKAKGIEIYNKLKKRGGDETSTEPPIIKVVITKDT